MKFIIRILALAIVAVSITVPHVCSERKVTTHKSLKISSDSLAHGGDQSWIDGDSISDKIKFYGYEKTVNATKETLFVKNLTDSSFNELKFTITYFDTDGRKLHSRQINHRVELSPNDIRRIDFRSWDTQKSFYYVRGTHPKKSATPYDINIKLDSIRLDLHASH